MDSGGNIQTVAGASLGQWAGKSQGHVVQNMAALCTETMSRVISLNRYSELVGSKMENSRITS